MIDRGHALPLVAQARQLGISRGGIYYLPRAVPDADLAIMRRIDELHLLYSFAGSRMLRDLLRQEGVEVGRLHIATLMKRMRIEALYRRPDTSKPAPGHKIYPYLLRKLAVTRPNQVWAEPAKVPAMRSIVGKQVEGRNLRVPPSPPSSCARRSPSAWTAKAAGATTCSWSASGAR